MICDAPLAFGASWNRDGVIILSREGLGPIERVDANGGTPRPVTRVLPQEEAHRWPFFLPDGDHFVFLGDAPRTEDHHLKVGSLRDGSSRDLLQGVTNVIYVEPGQLLFVRGGALMAVAFDPKTLNVSGEPRVIAEDVLASDSNHRFEFSASQNGRLLYRSGSADSQLTWVDRSGKQLGTLGDPRRIGFIFRISPDQQRVIAEQNDADGRSDDLWIFDSARGVTTRFTFDPAGDLRPVWSPDGSRIAFASMRTGLGEMYVADTATPANVQRLTTTEEDVEPSAWSHDGAFILADNYRKSDADILMIAVSTHQRTPYLSTRFNEYAAALSPDDSLVAYVSDESGRDEVYVERFPTHAARRQISTSGGARPLWRGDGKELFYIAPGGQLTSIDMTADAATPKPLFHLRGVSYDVTRDGQHFVVDQPIDDTIGSPWTFVSNWMGLRR